MSTMLNNARRARLRVAFVGGMDRIAPELVAAGEEVGIDVEVHRGDVHGRKSEGLEGVVRRADHVIIVTGVNSHGGAIMAKRLGHRFGVPIRIMKSCGLALARGVLSELATSHGAAMTG